MSVSSFSSSVVGAERNILKSVNVRLMSSRWTIVLRKRLKDGFPHQQLDVLSMKLHVFASIYQQTCSDFMFAVDIFRRVLRKAQLSEVKLSLECSRESVIIKRR